MTKHLIAAFLSLALAFGAAPLQARITGTAPTNDDVVCWGVDGAEACINAAGDIVSTTTNDTDLGTSSLLWNELHLTAGGLTDAAILTADLASGAVTTPKILVDSITSEKIINDGVTTAKIRTAAVVTAKIDDDAVTSLKIINAGVTTAKIGSGVVTTAKLYLDQPSQRVACITTGKLIGTCQATNAGLGCDCQ